MEEPPRKLTWREQQELKRRQREADEATKGEGVGDASGAKKDVAALIRERVAAAKRDQAGPADAAARGTPPAGSNLGSAGTGRPVDVGATSAVVDWRGNLKRRTGDVVVPAPAAASGRQSSSSPTRSPYKPRSHRHPPEDSSGGRGDSGDKSGGDGPGDADDGPAEDPRAALMAMLGRRSAPGTPSGAPAVEAPKPPSPAPVNPVAAMIQQRAAAAAPPDSDPAPNPAAALGAMFAKRAGHAAAAPSPGPSASDTAKDDARGALNAMLAGRAGGPDKRDGRPALRHDPK